MKKGKLVKVVSGITTFAFIAGGGYGFSDLTPVFAADIGYNKSTGKEIYNFGEVNSLVVRLGFSDYPLDESNEYYTDDDYVKMLFEGGENGLEIDGRRWGGVSDFLETSSYGHMSLKVGNIVDYHFDYPYGEYAQNYYMAGDSAAIEMVEKIIDEGKIDVSSYEAVYFLMNVPHTDTQKPEETYGFVYDRVINNKLKKICVVNQHFPNDLNTNFFVALHETGHLLFNLADYYKLDGFYSYRKNIGISNIMGNDFIISDYDGFSKYLIGWIKDEETSYIDMYGDDEVSGEMKLSPSDSYNSSNPKLAFFDFGERKVVAEYVSGENNNYIGRERKNGFRFYLVGDKNEMKEAYYESDEEGGYQVFAEGEDILNLFGLGLNVKNIITGDSPSFTWENSYEPQRDYYEEDKIKRIDLRQQPSVEGTESLVPAENEAGTAFLIFSTRDDRKYILKAKTVTDEMGDTVISLVIADVPYKGEINNIQKDTYNDLLVFSDENDKLIYPGESGLVYRIPDIDDDGEMTNSYTLNIFDDFLHIRNIKTAEDKVTFDYSYEDSAPEAEIIYKDDYTIRYETGRNDLRGKIDFNHWIGEGESTIEAYLEKDGKRFPALTQVANWPYHDFAWIEIQVSDTVSSNLLPNTDYNYVLPAGSLKLKDRLLNSEDIIIPVKTDDFSVPQNRVFDSEIETEDSKMLISNMFVSDDCATYLKTDDTGKGAFYAYTNGLIVKGKDIDLGLLKDDYTALFVKPLNDGTYAVVAEKKYDEKGHGVCIVRMSEDGKTLSRPIETIVGSGQEEYGSSSDFYYPGYVKGSILQDVFTAGTCLTFSGEGIYDLMVDLSDGSEKKLWEIVGDAKPINTDGDIFAFLSNNSNFSNDVLYVLDSKGEKLFEYKPQAQEEIVAVTADENSFTILKRVPVGFSGDTNLVLVKMDKEGIIISENTLVNKSKYNDIGSYTVDIKTGEDFYNAADRNKFRLLKNGDGFILTYGGQKLYYIIDNEITEGESFNHPEMNGKGDIVVVNGIPVVSNDVYHEGVLSRVIFELPDNKSNNEEPEKNNSEALEESGSTEGSTSEIGLEKGGRADIEGKDTDIKTNDEKINADDKLMEEKKDIPAQQGEENVVRAAEGKKGSAFVKSVRTATDSKTVSGANTGDSNNTAMVVSAIGAAATAGIVTVVSKRKRED